MSAAKLWLIANQNYTINFEISAMWETEPRMIPQKTAGLLIDRSRSPGLKPCKLDYDDDESLECIACQEDALVNVIFKKANGLC